jgi:hypothetical protein
MCLKLSSDDFRQGPDASLKESILQGQFLAAENFARADSGRRLSQAGSIMARWIKREVVVHRLKPFYGAVDIF